jgi:hypothetical protein
VATDENVKFGTLVAPKNAVPVGTVAGVQLAAVLKSELVGAVDQVASWAWAGIAASNATAAVVADKYARILLAPLRGDLSTRTGSLLRQCGLSELVAMFFQSAAPIILRL